MELTPPRSQTSWSRRTLEEGVAALAAITAAKEVDREEELQRERNLQRED